MVNSDFLNNKTYECRLPGTDHQTDLAEHKMAYPFLVGTDLAYGLKTAASETKASRRGGGYGTIQARMPASSALLLAKANTA